MVYKSHTEEDEKMSNMQSVAYAPDGMAAVIPRAKTPKAASRLFGRRATRKLSQEDLEIVAALEAVQSDMDFLHSCFEHATDEVLIDSLVYELKAVHLKHQYYITLCKKKGISYGGNVIKH